MTKFNNFIKSRAFIITLTITFIFLILVGVTYAWYTWTSTDNTNITMQIGETTVVTYVGGNAINVNNLTPVYSYTNEPSTTFTLTNNNTNNLKIFKYNVYLDITSIASELISPSLKFVLLDGSSNVVDQGSFSTASTGSTLTITENQTLPSSTSSYTFIIYLDANEQSNTNMMNKSLSGTLRVTAVMGNIERHVTTAEDFEYVLFDHEDTAYDVDYILLARYIANYPIIEIPSTMTVNNKTYTTIFKNGPAPNSTFSNNTVILDVVLPSDFWGAYWYNGATTLSINRSMAHMFYCCTSLVTAPVIPDSVTDISSTFSGCTSLVNAPTIPNSVTGMSGTFQGCTSLVTAPVIPSSVANIGFLFNGCTNLTGTVRIESANASYSPPGPAAPFLNTTKPITVEVPENSTTYTKLNGSVPTNVTVTTFTP